MNIPTPKTSFYPVRSLQFQGVGSSALSAAMEIGLFDALADGPALPEQIAEATGTLDDRLDPLLDVCVVFGLLERKGAKYSNTPTAAEFLVSSSPLFQGKAMQLNTYFMSLCTENMVHLLRNKEGLSEQAAPWAADFAMEGTAQEAMAGPMQRAVEIIAELPGFSEFTRMCDIGGNHGTFSMLLTDRNPSLRAVICDLPDVVETAAERCRKLGYDGRVETMAYDMRKDQLPEASFDLALASHVFYSLVSSEDAWAEALGRICRSLKPGGWFVSHHMAKDEDTSAKDASLLDLVTRLAGYKSHFLPVDTLSDMLAAYGLQDIRVVKTSSKGWSTLVAARKPL